MKLFRQLLNGASLALLLALSPCASAQTASAPGQVAAAQAGGGAAKLIKVEAAVLERDGKPVENLSAEDFRVELDGVPQAITFFARESPPLSYSLLVDNTGSLRTLIDPMIRVGEAIVAARGERDEMSVVRFVSRDRIELMQDFTRNRNALVAALEGMYVEGGETALLEALYVAAEAVVARAPGDERRRALVVITDGGERDARAKLDEVLDYSRLHNVPIYVFGLTDALGDDAFSQVKGGRRKSRELLDTLARETGGYAVFPKKTSEFAAAAQALNARLQTPRYTLGFASSTDPSNRKPNITIKLADPARQDGRQLLSITNLRARGGAAAPVKK
ncbi:MAG: Ca-activated chloride channel [Pyrinomonadaceae bacterium]|jgi:Ca-activated chloride channel family protein|nr:Ca-activated chloride channel [Pyrinomonadaceae bacterium]